MDSGVIYLVIVGLWGAAVIPHLVRRREQLAAARAGDRASAALRVLGRRPDVNEAVTERPAARAYVLAPPARRGTESVAGQAVLARGVGTGTGTGTGTGGPGGHRPRGRRLLAATVLTLLAGLPLAAVALAVAALLGVAHPVLPLTPLAALVVVVGLLRGRARLRARPVHAGARGHEGVAAGKPLPGRTTAPVPVPAPVGGARGSAPAPPVVDVTDAALAVSRAARRAPVDPRAWTPVPVPPPTYTLKPAAPRPAAPGPAHGEVPGVAVPPAPRVVDVTDAALGDLSAVIERRRAVGA